MRDVQVLRARMKITPNVYVDMIARKMTGESDQQYKLDLARQLARQLLDSNLVEFVYGEDHASDQFFLDVTLCVVPPNDVIKKREFI